MITKAARGKKQSVMPLFLGFGLERRSDDLPRRRGDLQHRGKWIVLGDFKRPNAGLVQGRKRATVSNGTLSTPCEEGFATSC